MSKRLLELDALRGVAAVIVVIFHINLFFPFVQNHLIEGVIKYGATGVDLFFMISGFVIAWTLQKTKYPKDFIVSRFARLYPAYWTCVTITAICMIVFLLESHKSSSFILFEYLPNLTMFQRFFGVRDIDDVYWTLIAEMVFYIYMFIIFRFKKLNSTEYIALITMLPLFIYSSKYFQSHFLALHHFLQSYLPITNYFPLFVMGIIYYKIKFDKPTVFRYAAILVCMACQISLYGNGLKSDLFLTFKDYIDITIVYNIIFLLFVFNKLQFLVNKVSLFFGKISYPLYLVHYFLSVYIIIPTLISFDVPVIVASGFAFVFAIALATVVSRFIEIPFNKSIRNRFQTKETEPGLENAALAPTVAANILTDEV